MCGHNLFGHLDGSISSPSKMSSQNNQQIKNPIYLVWFLQDQLIQNTILASVEPTFAATIAATDTTKDTWDTQQLYMQTSHKEEYLIYVINCSYYKRHSFYC